VDLLKVDFLQPDQSIGEQNQERKTNLNLFYAMPAALKVPWSEIRRCAELGVVIEDVAKRFGISHEAIRKRSQREKWLLPSRVQKLREEMGIAEAVSGSVQQPPTKESVVPEIVSGTLAEMGADLQTTVMRGTLAALKRANLAGLPIESWGDAKTAVEVGLKVSGLEANAGPSLNVLFTGATAPLVEIDALESVPRGTIDVQEPADIL
jgi:hypothetical protein